MRAGQGQSLSLPGMASQRALLQKRVRSIYLSNRDPEVFTVYRLPDRCANSFRLSPES
jgi:hypothetical protein